MQCTEQIEAAVMELYYDEREFEYQENKTYNKKYRKYNINPLTVLSHNLWSTF